MKRCFIFFILIVVSCSFAQKQIDIDFSDVVDTIKSDLLGGNKGPGISPYYLHETGIKYIRTHDYQGPADYCFYSNFWNTDTAGNFTDINTSFDPSNPADYDWFPTDSQLDEIVSNGFDIYFRIGVSYPNPMFTPMATYEPPSNSESDSMNFSKFASLCKRTVMHYNDGWDSGFHHNIRYFEIWNEPGGVFWNGTAAQFYKMFKAVSDSIKSYDPSIQIGGPGAVPTTSIGINNRYREHFLEFLDTSGTELDFYSWHIYGTDNPYSIKEYADTIRALLDYHGFYDAESHISEINHNLDSTLDTFVPSPLGAAYYLSLVLTAQQSPIDKFFWYPSVALTSLRSAGIETTFTQSASAIKAFHMMQMETPMVVYSTGDEVIDGCFDCDTTNFMTLAAKSTDDEKLYILVSNYRSSNSDYRIAIRNLPWSSSDSVEVRKNFIIDTLNFVETVDTIAGCDSLIIFQPDMDAPSVLFLRITKVASTIVDEDEIENEKIRVYPNPTNRTITIAGKNVKRIAVFDETGKIVLREQIGSKNARIDMRKFPPGIYFIKAETNDGTITQKITIE